MLVSDLIKYLEDCYPDDDVRFWNYSELREESFEEKDITYDADTGIVLIE